MLWDIRLRLALILLDLYLFKEMVENMDDGTESLEEREAATSDDAEEISRSVAADLLTGLKKRKYQALNSNSITLDLCIGWWRVNGSSRIL